METLSNTDDGSVIVVGTMRKTAEFRWNDKKALLLYSHVGSGGGLANDDTIASVLCHAGLEEM